MSYARLGAATVVSSKPGSPPRGVSSVSKRTEGMDSSFKPASMRCRSSSPAAFLSFESSFAELYAAFFLFASSASSSQRFSSEESSSSRPCFAL